MSSSIQGYSDQMLARSEVIIMKKTTGRRQNDTRREEGRKASIPCSESCVIALSLTGTEHNCRRRECNVCLRSGKINKRQYFVGENTHVAGAHF